MPLKFGFPMGNPYCADNGRCSVAGYFCIHPHPQKPIRRCRHTPVPPNRAVLYADSSGYSSFSPVSINSVMQNGRFVKFCHKLTGREVHKLTGREGIKKYIFPERSASGPAWTFRGMRSARPMRQIRCGLVQGIFPPETFCVRKHENAGRVELTEGCCSHTIPLPGRKAGGSENGTSPEC